MSGATIKTAIKQVCNLTFLLKPQDEYHKEIIKYGERILQIKSLPCASYALYEKLEYQASAL